MSGAAKSNVLMFLAAMCAVGTVWLAVSAISGGLIYAAIAVLLAVATVIAFRAYRKEIRLLDEQERQAPGSAGPREHP